jgi:hypothetical protein
MSGIAALKGYRTQFIYSLYHILQRDGDSSSFLLEGVEDLDEYGDTGQLAQVIQVKNLNRPLVLSDLLSREGTSFVRRFLNIVYTSPSTSAVLITYSHPGEELERLMASSEIGQKDKPIIRKYEISEVDWQTFKHRTSIIKVNEDELIASILDRLTLQWPPIDPVTTADILLQWLSICAEKQIIINRKMLYEKVESFGLYLSERIAASAQLGKYLMPLSVEPKTDTIKLAEEFYQGVSARYEHILENLDIFRPHQLAEIESIYAKDSIAILYGASGQGKSTLGYRYLREHTTSTLAYELYIIEDSETTREAILTIGSISKGLGLPVTIIINVPPNNISWINIVAQCAHLSFIRFLVTIRQEDWFKSQQAGIIFLHQAVEISFHKPEAAEIYDRLNEKVKDLKHTDFEEAWLQFGGAGPLLEFVYTVTQGAPLKNRLHQQIATLQSEEKQYPQVLEILRMVSLADAFGAGLDVERLKSVEGLFAVTARLEKEFLVKVSSDKKLITGFHPLRSRLLLDFLFDEFIVEKRTYIKDLLNVVTDEETYVFLLNLFHERIIDPKSLTEELKKNNPQYSWAKYHGIIRALLWSGVRSYVEEHLSLFEEYHADYKDAWYILLDIYFGSTLDHQKLLTNLQFPEEVRKKAEQTSHTLSNKTMVYDHAINFIQAVELPAQSLQSGADLAGYGGLLFWTGQFSCSKQMSSYAVDDLKKWSDLATTEQMATLMLGLHTASGKYEENRQGLEQDFIQKIRKSHHITDLEVNDTNVSATYLVDILSEGTLSDLNNRSVAIADLLRRAIPTKKIYSTKAMGHHLDTLPSMHDDSVKNMPIENLHLAEWTGMNYTLKNLFENRHRPKDWTEYLKQVSGWESKVVEQVRSFIKLMPRFLSGKGDWQVITPLVSNGMLNYSAEIKSPASIQDPLALFVAEKKITGDESVAISEGKPIDRSEKIARLNVKFKDFTKSQRDYKASIESFLIQSSTAMYERASVTLNMQKTSDDNNVRLSQYNLLKAIKAIDDYQARKQEHFSKYVDLQAAELTSTDLFKVLILWRSFITRTNEKKGQSISLQQVDQTKDDLISRITKTFRNSSKNENFRISFKMDKTTGNRPVVMLDADHAIVALDALNQLFGTLKTLLTAESGNVKQLVLDIYFDPIYVITLVQGHTINSGWYEIPLYKLEKNFSQLNIFDLTPKTIVPIVFTNFNLVDWSTLIPKVSEFQSSLGQLLQVNLLVQQLKDIAILQTDNMDELKESLLQNNFNKAAQQIAVGFQKVLDALAIILEDVTYDLELYNIDVPETEYINGFLAIKDHLYPENGSGADSQSLRFNLQDTIAWSPRLQVCYEKMSTIFFLLLQKYIDSYNVEQALNLLPHLKDKKLITIADFFQLDFSTVPDASFNKGKSEINASGTSLVNYYKRLNVKDLGIFDAVTIKYFEPGSYNIIFEGTISNPHQLAMIKWLMIQFTQLNGNDSNERGKLTSEEMMDIIAGRFWTGRFWQKTNQSKLPDMLIDAGKRKIHFTIFNPVSQL